MRRKQVPCGLCEKQETRNDHGVCHDCIGQWKLGARRTERDTGEAKKVLAHINWYPHMATYHGDVEGKSEIYWSDIAEAMGAVSVRDITWADKERYIIGQAQGRHDDNRSLECVEVPERRAKAMQRVIAAFFNGVAQAHAKGVDEGRSLLAGLARGDVKISDFDEITEAARMQKKRRRDR